MSWCIELACGVYVGILMICLIQAQHVSTLWGREGQHVGSQRLNLYGTLQHGGGMTRGGYPQDKLKQASGSGGLRTGGYVRPPSSGKASVKFVQSGSVSSPTVPHNPYVINAPNKQLYSVSTPRKPSHQTYGSTDKRKEKKTSQQGARHAGRHLSKSVLGAHGLSRGRYLFTPAAQNPPAMTGQQGAKVSKQRTSASTLGRRVSSRKTYSGVGRPLITNVGRSDFSSTKAGVSQASGSRKATSWVPFLSGKRSEARLLAPTMKHSITTLFGGSTIRRLKSSDRGTASIRTPHHTHNKPVVGQSGPLKRKWSFRAYYR